MNYKKIRLKKGRDRSVINFHPWIFSGALQSPPALEDGEIVDVLSAENTFLGRAFYNNGSIAARIFSFTETPVDLAFWEGKLRNAYNLRQNSGIINTAETDVYRLIHGEGDGIPGLVTDIFGNAAVLQCHNHGVYRLRETFASALKNIFGKSLEVIYDKSSETMPGETPYSNGFLLGDKNKYIVKEHNHKFNIDFIEGQKTGFFIDQRENRQLLASLSRNKKVLNTFCYSGGFSVYALSGGASEVHSVDSSRKAIQLTDENIELNNFKEKHTSFVSDTFDFLKKNEDVYDVIVLDPPAFAKHQGAIKNACMGYQRLNQQAIEKIKPGGILFTFSCSQAIDKELFRKVVFAAAAKTSRNVRILHQLSQPADHPVSIYHPEGEYLKGLVLAIE